MNFIHPQTPQISPRCRNPVINQFEKPSQMMKPSNPAPPSGFSPYNRSVHTVAFISDQFPCTVSRRSAFRRIPTLMHTSQKKIPFKNPTSPFPTKSFHSSSPSSREPKFLARIPKAWINHPTRCILFFVVLVGAA